MYPTIHRVPPSTILLDSPRVGWSDPAGSIPLNARYARASSDVDSAIFVTVPIHNSSILTLETIVQVFSTEVGCFII